jgi:hypothetical protein
MSEHIGWTTTITAEVSIMKQGDEAEDFQRVDEPVGVAIGTGGGGTVIIEGTHYELIKFFADLASAVANHSVNAHLTGDGS